MSVLVILGQGRLIIPTPVGRDIDQRASRLYRRRDGFVGFWRRFGFYSVYRVEFIQVRFRHSPTTV